MTHPPLSNDSKLHSQFTFSSVRSVKNAGSFVQGNFCNLSNNTLVFHSGLVYFHIFSKVDVLLGFCMLLCTEMMCVEASNCRNIHVNIPIFL